MSRGSIKAQQGNTDAAVLNFQEPFRSARERTGVRDSGDATYSKLVTLSACDTGVGPVGETGVVNLVNAFIGAGAHSVISTLWELADQPTSRLMKTFYAGLAEHESKGEALRNANWSC